MEKKQIETIGVIVLIFILIGTVARGILSVKKTKAQVKQKITELKNDQGTAQALPVPAPAETPQEKTSKDSVSWEKDPFNYGREVTQTKVSGQSLKVKGVVWDEKNPYAIVDGKIVKQGDKIGTVEIIEIRKKSVVIKEDSQMYEIFLEE